MKVQTYEELFTVYTVRNEDIERLAKRAWLFAINIAVHEDASVTNGISEAARVQFKEYLNWLDAELVRATERPRSRTTRVDPLNYELDFSTKIDTFVEEKEGGATAVNPDIDHIVKKFVKLAVSFAKSDSANIGSSILENDSEDFAETIRDIEDYLSDVAGQNTIRLSELGAIAPSIGAPTRRSSTTTR